MTVPRPHASAFVAGNDAPLSGEGAERAGALRWKVVMSARVRRAAMISFQAREPDRTAGMSTR
jgi:hypothetical protein